MFEFNTNVIILIPSINDIETNGKSILKINIHITCEYT